MKLCIFAMTNADAERLF